MVVAAVVVVVVDVVVVVVAVWLRSWSRSWSAKIGAASPSGLNEKMCPYSSARVARDAGSILKGE